MFNQKTLAPVDGLFDQGYKLSYFCEDLSKYVENQSKSLKIGDKASKTLHYWYKKDVFHIEMIVPFCPECYSKNMIKNGFKERILYFYDKGVVESEIQAYKCKKCGKKFDTDISEIVGDNSNFTHDFKRKCLELVGLFFGSVRNVAYKLKEDTGISVSRQTVENWILEYKNENKEDINRYSGYYIFDVEWIKIKGIWNHRFTLFDSKQNIIVADEIYSKENSKNILEFLEENTRNKEKIAITTDLDEKYKPIIEQLGFKHQWCLFHAFKNFNKIIRKYIKENKLSKDEIDQIRKEKLELFSLFDNKSFQNARNKLNEILTRINDYSKVIQSIIRDLLLPYFKTFFAFLEDENIERTTNKIENVFQKTFPKSVKKLMKIKNGAMSRINIRKQIQNQKKLLDSQPPSF
jgi:transposase-like protein